MRKKLWKLGLILALGCCTAAQAAVLSLQGDLDAGNPNDVVLIPFSLAQTADLSIQSWGFGGSSAAPGGVNAAGDVVAGGGFDPYVSLFFGHGPTATFLVSNDDGNCPPGTAAPACADSTLFLAAVGAGDYTLALTLPFNYSFAENLGAGNLGDGFIGLDSSFDDGWCAGRCSSHYAVDIVTAPTGHAAPEPAAMALVALALAALAHTRRRIPTSPPGEGS